MGCGGEGEDEEMGDGLLYIEKEDAWERAFAEDPSAIPRRTLGMGTGEKQWYIRLLSVSVQGKRWDGISVDFFIFCGL